MNREAVLQSLEELRGQIERHERVLKGELPATAQGPNRCAPDGCQHKKRLCQFLLETAAILDSTRKAFKSRQLEALRKECLSILSEELGTAGSASNPHTDAVKSPAQP